MAETVRQLLDGYRWAFAEKGLQVVWNRMNQALAGQAPASGLTAGTTDLDTMVVDDGAAGALGIQKGTRPIIGPFAATGAEAATVGEKVRPTDPGGNIGPTPLRQSNSLPLNGFRPTA